MLNGITVILYEKTMIGEDDFGAPIYKEDSVEVHDVLVAPSSSTAEAERTNLDGKVATYQLAIPKGDNHKWEDSIVEFFGQKWHTVGFVIKGIDELVPTKWNAKVEVERHG